MKKPLLILATLVCAVALYIAYQYSKGLTPEAVMQELFDMNAPALPRDQVQWQRVLPAPMMRFSGAVMPVSGTLRRLPSYRL